MYKASIYADDDTLLRACVGTLQDVRSECIKYFLDFDSADAIQCYLGKVPSYAKAYQGVRDSAILPPAFVHIKPVAFPYIIS